MNQRDIISHSFRDVISLENLFLCWRDFRKGKRGKSDIQGFEFNLEDNVFELHSDLSSQVYHHGPYYTFHICDPKYRVISKASVRDRLVHHLVFNELYRIFEPSFIYHSYSSRLNKGTHLAVRNLNNALRKISKNYRQNVYVLKCDVKQFFHSVSHQKLFAIIKQKTKDEKFLWLVSNIIDSFNSTGDNFPERERERERERELNGNFKIGIPIGNVTSQILANIYLNELDQFIKHRLKVKYYFRYADDFVILYSNQQYLENLLTSISNFLKVNLNLQLHPNKIIIGKFRQGIDFLGYVILPHYILLRTKTKRRMFKKIKRNLKELQTGLIPEESFNQSLQSYLGILKHCHGYEIKRKLSRAFLNG